LRTQALQAQNTKKLYSHQVETFAQFNKKLLPPRRAKTKQGNAQELLGNHIIITTPTSSGKSLCFNLCVFDRILKNRGKVTTLCLFPLKALIKDQAAKMKKLNSFLREDEQLSIVLLTGISLPALL